MSSPIHISQPEHSEHSSDFKEFGLIQNSFNPRPNTPPNEFVGKLEHRFKSYYHHKTLYGSPPVSNLFVPISK